LYLYCRCKVRKIWIFGHRFEGSASGLLYYGGSPSLISCCCENPKHHPVFSVPSDATFCWSSVSLYHGKWIVLSKTKPDKSLPSSLLQGSYLLQFLSAKPNHVDCFPGLSNRFCCNYFVLDPEFIILFGRRVSQMQFPLPLSKTGTVQNGQNYTLKYQI
jgi:hypothetical protein